LTPGARDGLRQGEPATVLTHLVVREDSLTLYGFADAAERDVFVTVQSTSGVGPKLALAMVSTLGADGLTKAVASEDITALTKVPGIGRKGAQKLVLSLSGKLGSMGAGRAGLPGGAASSIAAQVEAALVQLGFSAQVAGEAVAAASGEPGAPEEVAGLLRAALRRLRASQ
jgi:Holliday junction DNA helicase RuvA